MRKHEFLSQLRRSLSHLSDKDLDDQLMFYSEMIDDRREEGLSEADAVAAIGSIDEIAQQILSDSPHTTHNSQANKKSRQRSIWMPVLLLLGSPIWISLGCAVIAVALSLYCALWAVILSLWATFAAIIAASVGCGLAGAFVACRESVSSGLALLAAGFVCAGLSIFLFLGCWGTTKACLTLTEAVGRRLKTRLLRKENQCK